MTGGGVFLLSAETTFSAAHSLPGCGMCENLHGHNWRVRLTVRVEESKIDSSGMGVDFLDIERIAKQAVQDFDHAYLNDLEAFSELRPTAESIARELFVRSARQLEKESSIASVAEIEVWEMPEYRAVYRPE